MFSSVGIPFSGEDSTSVEPLFVCSKASRALRRCSLSTSSASSMLLWAVSLWRKEDTVWLITGLGVTEIVYTGSVLKWTTIASSFFLSVSEQNIYVTPLRFCDFRFNSRKNITFLGLFMLRKIFSLLYRNRIYCPRLASFHSVLPYFHSDRKP